MESSNLISNQLQAQLRHILPRLRWEASRLGTIGKIGLGLLVIAVVLLFTMVFPQETTVQTLKSRAETLQAQPLSQSQKASRPTQKISDNQALQIFYDFFPHIDSSPFWIRELTKIAKSHRVEINSSDYRLVKEKDDKLARYEMILPVRGRYPQIRAFIADALQEVPAMAISGMVIKRDNVKTEQLDVRLEINLYLDV
ncbi:MAG: hypothetical protein NMNS01_23880 [Nitrosomonas sp.]|jgi:hypothetical protein|nr:MAG: hypothetical protein NMNS01_23880 [Nitrosomonas sp.]